MKEFFRVLSSQGTLVFSELFSDPDYPLPVTIERMAESSGFQRRKKIGNFIYYTLIFEKSSEP